MNEVTPSINPNNLTVTNKEALTLVLDNLGETDITLHNDHGYTAADVPDFDSPKELEGFDYFYLFFDYGDQPEDLMEGDGSSIQYHFSQPETDWDIISVLDPTRGTYWKLCPVKTLVWKRGSVGDPNVQVAIKFSEIRCNAVSGKTQMHIKPRLGDTLSVDLWKHPMPSIADFKPASAIPCYIGEKGVLQWTVPDHSFFTIRFNGTELHPDKDFQEETVTIQYGEYLLEVKNRADYTVQKKTQFPLEIIRQFEVNKLTPQEATFTWDVEEKNADKWYIKQVADNLSASGKQQTFPTATTADRTFEMIAVIKGCSTTVSVAVPFQIPVITSFEAASLNRVANCAAMLRQMNPDGFLPPELVLSAPETRAACFTFYNSCKSGPTTYGHRFIWSGEQVTSYLLKMDSGRDSGKLPPEQHEATLYTTSSQDGATLSATGQFEYTVKKHS